MDCEKIIVCDNDQVSMGLVIDALNRELPNYEFIKGCQYPEQILKIIEKEKEKVLGVITEMSFFKDGESIKEGNLFNDKYLEIYKKIVEKEIPIMVYSHLGDLEQFKKQEELVEADGNKWLIKCQVSITELIPECQGFFKLSK